MSEHGIKHDAMAAALVGTPDEFGPFAADDEAAAHFASGVVRRYEAALAAAGYQVITIAPHPFTCGACTWEGPTRDAYFAHCVAVRHDHWQRLLTPAPQMVNAIAGPQTGRGVSR